jgi:hypothetical protein
VCTASIAASSIGLYRTTRVGSIPQDAEYNDARAGGIDAPSQFMGCEAAEHHGAFRHCRDSPVASPRAMAAPAMVASREIPDPGGAARQQAQPRVRVPGRP